MKNIITTIIKPALYLSMIVCVLLWSCNKDDATFDPSQRLKPLIITEIIPDSSLVGTTVTIIGTNFSANPTENLVTFNGSNGLVTAVVTASSSNSITANVPNGAVTGKVAVTTNNEETSGTEFTVTYLPPTITSISETSAVEGSEIIITGTNFSPLARENKVKINGSDEISITESTSTSITFIIPVGTPIGTSPIIVSVQGVEVSGPDFTVLEAITLTIPINVEEDDVEESTVNGQMNLTSGDLELGELDTGFSPDDGDGLPNIGLRFVNVDIPQGVVIKAASIQFTADSSAGTDPVELTIYGEAVGNAEPYTNTPGNLSARTQTTASKIWTITEEWSTTSGEDKTSAQRTVDLSSIVQEIINRPDWVSGNSINFFIIATGASATPSGTSVGREAEGFSDSNPSDTPELSVTYLK